MSRTRNLAVAVIGVGVLVSAGAAGVSAHGGHAASSTPPSTPMTHDSMPMTHDSMAPHDSMPMSHDSMAPHDSMPMTHDSMAGHDMTGFSPAADLRASLEFLLQEHVYLAGIATNEALSGRMDGFHAAAATLDANSDAITAAIGSVYGKAAGDAFGPLWKKHIGFFVDYTTAIAGGDQAKADKAKADLAAYAGEFGAFLESATGGALTKDAVAKLVGDHASTLIAAIDAQKAGDATKAFTALKAAAGHMTMIAEPLAAAIAKQQGIQGDPSSATSNLRALLTRNLQEHVYLAGIATGEALGGRMDSFHAAAATLDANSDDLIAAVGSVYGKAAGDAFGPLWKKHIGFFVDYTTAIAGGDQAKADKAKADLAAYAGEFGAFLESATAGGLTKDAVAKLVGDHAMTLIAAIDAEKAGDATAAYTALRTAAGHMTTIADALALAISHQQGLAA